MRNKVINSIIAIVIVSLTLDLFFILSDYNFHVEKKRAPVSRHDYGIISDFIVLYLYIISWSIYIFSLHKLKKKSISLAKSLNYFLTFYSAFLLLPYFFEEKSFINLLTENAILVRITFLFTTSGVTLICFKKLLSLNP